MAINENAVTDTLTPTTGTLTVSGTTTTATLQSTTTGTPTQFNDGSGTQIGTLCRAWVSFVGGSTPTKNGSFNISSVTYTSTGIWAVSFTNALPDANYSVCVTSGTNLSSNSAFTNANSLTTTGFNVNHWEINIASNLGNSGSNYIWVAVFR